MVGAVNFLFGKLRTPASKETSLARSIREQHSFEAQRRAASELAAIATDNAFKTLRRMVEGRLAKYSSVAAKRDGIDDTQLRHQILGIEALGLTSHPDALEFLAHLYEATPVPGKDVNGYGYNEGQSAYELYKRYKTIEYPHARGSLRRALEFRVSVSWDTKNGTVVQEAVSEEDQIARAVENSNAHRTVREAIQKLAA